MKKNITLIICLLLLTPFLFIGCSCSNNANLKYYIFEDITDNDVKESYNLTTSSEFINQGGYNKYPNKEDITIYITLSFGWEATVNSISQTEINTKLFYDLSQAQKSGVMTEIQTKKLQLEDEGKNAEEIYEILCEDTELSKYIPLQVTWHQDTVNKDVFYTEIGKLNKDLVIEVNGISEKTVGLKFDDTASDLSPDFNLSNYEIKINNVLYDGSSMTISIIDNIEIIIKAQNNAIVPEVIYFVTNTDSFDFDDTDSAGQMHAESNIDGDIIVGPNGELTFTFLHDNYYTTEVENFIISLRSSLNEDLMEMRSLNIVNLGSMCDINKIKLSLSDPESYIIDNYYFDKVGINKDLYFAVDYSTEMKVQLETGFEYKINPNYTIIVKNDLGNSIPFVFVKEESIDINLLNVRKIYKVDKAEINSDINLDIDYTIFRVNAESEPAENGAEGESNFGLVKIQTGSEFVTCQSSAISYKDNLYYVKQGGDLILQINEDNLENELELNPDSVSLVVKDKDNNLIVIGDTDMEITKAYDEQNNLVYWTITNVTNDLIFELE